MSAQEYILVIIEPSHDSHLALERALATLKNKGKSHQSYIYSSVLM